MLLFNSFCIASSRIAILMLMTSAINAKVLELGESELRGKKDQPEAITFISRARLDQSVKPKEISFKHKISEEIDNSKVFDLVYTND